MGRRSRNILIPTAGAAAIAATALWWIVERPGEPSSLPGASRLVKEALSTDSASEPGKVESTSDARRAPDAQGASVPRLPVAPSLKPLVVFTAAAETNQAVPFAHIRVEPFWGEGDSVEAIGDVDGRAELIPTTEAPLRAEAWRDDLFGARDFVFAGQEVTLRLRPSTETTVFVEDEAGRAVENALVRIYQGGNRLGAGETDALGYSQPMRVPEGDARLVVEGRDFDRSEQSAPNGGVPPLWRIAIRRRAIEVFVRAVHENAPVEGVEVHDTRLSPLRSRTRADGRCRLGSYDAGQLVLVRAEHPDLLPVTVPHVVSEDAPEVLAELPAGRSLSVRAVDPLGRSVEDVRLRVHWVGGWAPDPSTPARSFAYFREGRTDERGECVLRGVSAGRYELRAEHPSFNVAELVSGDDSLVLELEPRTDVPVAIELGPTVERLLGREGWLVTAQKHSGSAAHAGGGMPRQQTTDREGVALLRQLASGTYLLGLSSPEERWVEHRLVVELAGEPWTYRGPEVAVRLVAEDDLTAPIRLEGGSYSATFAMLDDAWTAAARPGTASLEVASRAYRLQIGGQGEVQWVRVSELGPEEDPSRSEAR